MAGFPSTKKGNKRGEKSLQPRAGVPLTKTISVEEVGKLINQEHGNLSRVADIIGTTRGTVRRLCDNNPDLLELLKQARERQLDQLEQSVFDRAIESNDTTLQLFLLKTQGRSRGYDQDEAKNAAKDIATAAFDFILSKQKPS
jgi:hypothetical protein